jgi:beta-alanine--pyruvate transaminase
MPEWSRTVGKVVPGLSAYWMPFTPNRDFKAHPRMIESAKGVYYYDQNGRPILDGTSGLWCVPLGHSHPRIVEAVQKGVATLDYVSSFMLGHPKAFEFAQRLVEFAGNKFSQVFFTNSGSESVDTALKIALAYHRLKGEASRTRLIGRERAYHGVSFAGIAVGGMGPNRKHFGVGLPGVDHLPHTHDLTRNAFTKGLPLYGAEYSDELERLVTLHDGSNIAAVIVEPIMGSAGALFPPVGYLQRLRDICTRHGILLIFDEVITGFGRLTEPFASDFLGVVPDIMATAKGITNGAIPMGAVFVKKEIYDAFMSGPDGTELFHGYTYSGHPLACAAGLAVLDAFAEDGVLEQARGTAAYFNEAIHSLRDLPNVIDIRSVGMVGAVELEPRPGQPGARALEAFRKAFELGVTVRLYADNLSMAPPLIMERKHIDELLGKLRVTIQSSV